MTTIKQKASKVKSQKWDSFFKSISEGLSVESAAAAAGFTRQAFYKRLNKARQEREKYESDFEYDNKDLVLDNFDLLYDKAVATFEAENVAIIFQIAKGQGKGNWTAAAWFLERRFPEKYGRIRNDENTANEGRLTAAEMQAFLNTFSLRNSPIDNKEQVYDATNETMKLLGIDYNDLPILDARKVKESNDEFL